MASSNQSRHVAKPNETTNVTWARGLQTIEERRVAESVAMEDMAVLDYDGSGQLALADSSSTAIAALLLGTIATTDPDYATDGKLKKVITLQDSNNPYRLKMPVGTGTATAAMVGNTYDLADAYSLDVTAQVVNQFRISKYISASLVEGYFVV